MKTFVIGDVHGRRTQLETLLGMLPRDESSDTLVFLGDLIDRGDDAPGCVEHVIKVAKANPERVMCLRGNHEQMLLDFIAGTTNLWITPVTVANARSSSTQDTRSRSRLNRILKMRATRWKRRFLQSIWSFSASALTSTKMSLRSMFMRDSITGSIRARVHRNC